MRFPRRPHRNAVAWSVPLVGAILLTGAGSMIGIAGATTTATPARHVDTAVSFPGPTWVARTTTGGAVGYVTQSSPTVATVGGRTIVAVGAENGYLYVMDAATGNELPGWPRRMDAAPGQSVAIESSPTFAWVNGTNRPPLIIVGAASTWVKSTAGEVEAFRLSGAPEFVFHVGKAAGTAAGVISTPAVGDVLGNGQVQIVFGSWDHKIYILDKHGNQVGFAYDNADTIWSSPVLYRLPGVNRDDVFLGSDASGRPIGGGNRCVGGFVADYRFETSSVDPDTLNAGPGLTREWFRCVNQSIWSSPAVGTIGTSNTPVVVVGTSFYEQPFPSGTNRVYAFNAANGTDVPGWPVKTNGPALGSPAIGVIDGSGNPAVVETSWNCNGRTQSSCFVGSSSEVYAWSGSGHQIWSQRLLGPTSFASPVLVPLQGSTTNDVLIGSPDGLYPLNGANGAFLFGTNGSNQFAAINPGCRVFNSVAVAYIPGTDAGDGWHAIEACGGPPAFHDPGAVFSYRLPDQTVISAGWPMFRGSPEHSGIAFATLPNSPIVIPGIASVTASTTPVTLPSTTPVTLPSVP